MPREEWIGELSKCDYVDLTVSWVEDADYPSEWTCMLCGGSTFEGVHRDYPRSGLHPGNFNLTSWERREPDGG